MPRINIPTTQEAPKAGWGILNPDRELNPETLALIDALNALPEGQRDALLTRAVPRLLDLVMDEVDLEADREPKASNMVLASSYLSQMWMDILGFE